MITLIPVDMDASIHLKDQPIGFPAAKKHLILPFVLLLPPMTLPSSN